MRKRRWRTCFFFIFQILLSQARILDPSFFESNYESQIKEDEITNDDEIQLNKEKNDEVLDDLHFIQSFLTSITTPLPPKFPNVNEKIKAESNIDETPSDVVLKNQSKSSNYQGWLFFN